MQGILHRLRHADPISVALYILIAGLTAIWVAQPVKAADKGGLKKAAPAESVVPGLAPATTWTGCGLGVGANWTAGHVDFPGPINMGAESSSISGRALCDIQIKGFVIGGFVDYGRFFGDLKTIGVESALSVGGRAGPVFGNVLVYGHLAWTQIDTTGGKADGWKFGPGVELKLTDQPIFVSLEYRRAQFDTPVGSPYNVQANEFGLNLIYKFGPSGK